MTPSHFMTIVMVWASFAVANSSTTFANMNNDLNAATASLKFSPGFQSSKQLCARHRRLCATCRPPFPCLQYHEALLKAATMQTFPIVQILLALFLLAILTLILTRLSGKNLNMDLLDMETWMHTDDKSSKTVAAQILLYALSFGVTETVTTPSQPLSGKGVRKTFSLDSKLDTCLLPDIMRQRSCTTYNTLMAVRLDQVSQEPPVIGRASSSRKLNPTMPMRHDSHMHDTSLVNSQDSQADFMLGSSSVVREDSASESISSPSRRRHPGHKPQFKRMSQERKSDEEIDCERMPIVSDDNWDRERRAEAPASGRPMDGEDVGFTPLRLLELPQPQVPLTAVSMHGRSIFVCGNGQSQ